MNFRKLEVILVFLCGVPETWKLRDFPPKVKSVVDGYKKSKHLTDGSINKFKTRLVAHAPRTYRTSSNFYCLINF